MSHYATPGDLLEQADQIAQQLVGMHSFERHTQLTVLKADDEVLHAVVLSKLKKLRDTAGEAIGDDDG